MKFEKVTYLAAYVHPEYGTFAPLKLGLEISLNEGDTVEMALNAAKEKLDNWNKKVNKSIWTNPSGMTGTHTRTLEDGVKKPMDIIIKNIYEKALEKGDLETIEKIKKEFDAES